MHCIVLPCSASHYLGMFFGVEAAASAGSQVLGVDRRLSILCIVSGCFGLPYCIVLKCEIGLRIVLFVYCTDLYATSHVGEVCCIARAGSRRCLAARRGAARRQRSVS